MRKLDFQFVRGAYGVWIESEYLLKYSTLRLRRARVGLRNGALDVISVSTKKKDRTSKI